MPQRPGVLAVWNDNRQVRILDVSAQLAELAAEEQLPAAKPQKVTVGAGVIGFWPKHLGGFVWSSSLLVCMLRVKSWWFDTRTRMPAGRGMQLPASRCDCVILGFWGRKKALMMNLTNPSSLQALAPVRSTYDGI
jgi:hypothetical protein